MTEQLISDLRQEQLISDLQAAREIVANNWCSEGWSNIEGGLCIISALNMAVSGYAQYAVKDSELRARRNAACKQLAKYLPEMDYPALDVYNDDPATTHQDVINLYDKALADLGGLG